MIGSHVTSIPNGFNPNPPFGIELLQGLTGCKVEVYLWSFRKYEKQHENFPTEYVTERLRISVTPWRMVKASATGKCVCIMIRGAIDSSLIYNATLSPPMKRVTAYPSGFVIIDSDPTGDRAVSYHFWPILPLLSHKDTYHEVVVAIRRCYPKITVGIQPWTIYQSRKYMSSADGCELEKLNQLLLDVFGAKLYALDIERLRTPKALASRVYKLVRS